MALRGSLYRKIKKWPSYEERQAKKLQKLRKKRIKAEGRAKLRKKEAEERKRIANARGKHRGTGVGGFFAGIQTGAQRLDYIFTDEKPKKRKRR